MSKKLKISKETVGWAMLGIGALLIIKQKEDLIGMPAVTVPTVVGIFMVGRGTQNIVMG